MNNRVLTVGDRYILIANFMGLGAVALMAVIDVAASLTPFGVLGLVIKIVLGLAVCILGGALVSRRSDEVVASWYKPGEPRPKSDFPAHQDNVYPQTEMKAELTHLIVLGFCTGLGIGLGGYGLILNELAGAFTGLVSALVLGSIYFVMVRPNLYDAGCSPNK